MREKGTVYKCVDRDMTLGAAGRVGTSRISRRRCKYGLYRQLGEVK